MSETENPRGNRPVNSAGLEFDDIGGLEIIYQPLDTAEIPLPIRKHLKPQAEDARRLMIAKSIVPLPPAELGLTLYCLMADENPAVAAAAESAFDELPTNILRNMATMNLPAKVLDYIMRNYYDEDDEDRILEAVVFNMATGRETLKSLIHVAPLRILEMIAGNQNRLIREPGLVFEFGEGRGVTMGLLARILEFARRQNLITADEEDRIIDKFLHRGKAEEVVEEVRVEDVVKEIVGEDGAPDWEFPVFMTTDYETLMNMDADARIIEEKMKARMNMRDLIRKMVVPQKLRLAVRGNMEARKILIEDSLSMVAKSVLKSPRISKTEIERAAALKTIDPEVLEEIAKDGGFMRTYAIRHALVVNPKTPLTIANRLLSTLMEKDIKEISKSKAVPAAVQSIARQKMDAQRQRQEKREKQKKKK